MLTVSANTRHRVAIEDLSEVAVYGNPATVSVTRMRDGKKSYWHYDSENETYKSFPADSCPDFFDLDWSVDGIKVHAQLELVGSNYCSLDDIRAYRPEEYQLKDLADDVVSAARAHAVEVIEQECNRFFVPVIREALVERRNCTASKYPVVINGYANDLKEVVSATYADTGADVSLAIAGNGSVVDVSKVQLKRPVKAVFELGVGYVPQEVHDAVVALAAWYLLPKVGPDNATSQSTDAGVLRFVVGGVGGAETSLPEVNAAIARWGITDLHVR